MKLRTKFLLMCLVPTLLALSLQTLIFHLSSSRMIYNWAKTENESLLSNMQDEIYTQCKYVENALMGVYEETDFITALKDGLSAEELKSSFAVEGRAINSTYFDAGDGVQAIYLYTPEHEIISTYRRATTAKYNYPLDIYSDEEEYNAAVVKEYVASDSTGLMISSYYNQYREQDLIRFVLKFYYNKNYSDAIGYIVCDMNGSLFTSIMKKYSADSSVLIWLQPDNDRPAAYVGTVSGNMEELYEKLTGEILDAGEDDDSISENSGQEFFKVTQKKYNLSAYSLMSQELLRSNQKLLTRNLLLIVAVMVILVGIGYLFISKVLTEPLVRLTDTMSKIKAGDRHLRSDIRQKDEIGTLAVNFNEMLDHIETLQEEEKQANYLLSQAEYKALQAQINPHFLYNTLNTMSSIAELQDCMEVSAMCQSLSGIFHYSLNMKDTFSSVAQEIAHLKNYIYVMEVRMHNQIRYTFEIDDEALSVRIPKLSLQPLVENAINHGLYNKHGEKRITVEARILPGENSNSAAADGKAALTADTALADMEDMDYRVGHKETPQSETSDSVSQGEDSWPEETAARLHVGASDNGRTAARPHISASDGGVERTAARLRVSVSDNGVGMDCLEINERLKRNDKDYIEEGNSIGLYNINARIKMLYGEAWGLHVSSRPGEGTAVFFEVPVAE